MKDKNRAKNRDQDKVYDKNRDQDKGFRRRTRWKMNERMNEGVMHDNLNIMIISKPNSGITRVC